MNKSIYNVVFWIYEMIVRRGIEFKHFNQS